MSGDRRASWWQRVGTWLFGGNMLEGTTKALLWSLIWAVLPMLSYRLLNG